MPWDASHSIGVLLSAFQFGKFKLYKGLHIEIHVLALQLHTVLFVVPGAGLAVKCKDHGVKNSCFSGTGISGHKEEVLSRVSKIYIGFLSIGPEGLHG